MNDARKKLIDTVAATISGDLSNKLDVLESDIKRRQSVVSELDKHEVEARKKLEQLYADISGAGETLKKAEDEAESTKSTAHGHADQIRAKAKAEALVTAADATREADRVLSDARKARDAMTADLRRKSQEFKNTQAALDAAKTALAALKQQARKFADS